MAEILYSKNDNGVATITLDRPKALNSLTHEMVETMKENLEKWQNDDSVKVVLMKSSSERAFCAGGDIITLHAAKKGEAEMQAAEDFFHTEYETDQFIYEYTKPIIAILDGVVMGGGVGISYGASHRIVTEKTKWAMPEMNIAFFPDVGAAYFLNKAPGEVGKYLALTATTIGAEDVIYANAADLFCTTEKLPQLLEAIEAANWLEGSVDETLDKVFGEYCEDAPKEGTLEAEQAQIDKHFAGKETVEAIIESLEADDSEFARKTKETILSKSPVSTKVTLKQLNDGANKSLEECLATDLIIAKNFIRNEDFFEGVRSVLIDRDQDPKYKYTKLEEVSDEFVNSYFNEP
ncbi:MAG TPA: enoyl-CoA hydratase/isomerase family protein [Pseudogracilibacillus sp.]|nr:enoyl-CoA hydratase/isomerase family protein [Pseudogracilibacillus sp.]